MAVTAAQRAAISFQATWHTGRRVQMTARPRRKGTITAVQGTGLNASIIVSLDGWQVVAFRTYQLNLI